MPLVPEMSYHFDTTWPTDAPTVFLTPMRVWYPLTTMFFLFSMPLGVMFL